jgi:hypothetical protein
MELPLLQAAENINKFEPPLDEPKILSDNVKSAKI